MKLRVLSSDARARPGKTHSKLRVFLVLTKTKNVLLQAVALQINKNFSKNLRVIINLISLSGASTMMLVVSEMHSTPLKIIIIGKLLLRIRRTPRV